MNELCVVAHCIHRHHRFGMNVGSERSRIDVTKVRPRPTGGWEELSLERNFVPSFKDVELLCGVAGFKPDNTFYTDRGVFRGDDSSSCTYAELFAPESHFLEPLKGKRAKAALDGFRDEGRLFFTGQTGDLCLAGFGLGFKARLYEAALLDGGARRYEAARLDAGRTTVGGGSLPVWWTAEKLGLRDVLCVDVVREQVRAWFRASLPAEVVAEVALEPRASRLVEEVLRLRVLGFFRGLRLGRAFVVAHKDPRSVDLLKENVRIARYCIEYWKEEPVVDQGIDRYHRVEHEVHRAPTLRAIRVLLGTVPDFRVRPINLQRVSAEFGTLLDKVRLDSIVDGSGKEHGVLTGNFRFGWGDGYTDALDDPGNTRSFYDAIRNNLEPRYVVLLSWRGARFNPDDPDFRCPEKSCDQAYQLVEYLCRLQCRGYVQGYLVGVVHRKQLGIGTVVGRGALTKTLAKHYGSLYFGVQDLMLALWVG